MNPSTRPVKPVLIFFLVTVFTVALSACGGSGSSNTGTPDGGTPDGGTPDGETPDAGSPPGTTTDGGGTNNPDVASGLSHTPVQMPQGSAAQLTGPLFSPIGQAKAEMLASNPAVVMEVVENHSGDTGENCGDIGAQYGSCSVVNLHLKDTAAALDGNSWQLYFHSIRRVLRVDSAEFNVFHVNGDLHFLTPTASYTGFAATAVKTIKLVTEFSHLHESDLMPRYWLKREGQPAQIIANSDNDTDTTAYAVEITGDNRKAFNSEPTPIANSDNRFARNSDTALITDVSASIIPSPETVVVNGGTRLIGAGFAFDAAVLSADSITALNNRLAGFYTGSGSTTPVSTLIDTQLDSQAYRLEVSASGVALSGGSAEAVFNAAQSLLSLVTPGSNSIPLLSVVDQPRFDYRGMHADIARNFHGPGSLKKLIEQMSAYKLNRLHLHLSDDEGWRIEIPGLPELTAIGGNRQFQLDANGLPTETQGLLPALGSGPGTSNQGSGFLTRAEFIDLLQYANARYVQVIPELDMPGHARAAVVAMRARAAAQNKSADTDIRIDDPADVAEYLTIQHFRDGIINPCVDGTYTFITTVVSEVKAMFDAAGMNLDVWHMGGDEANNIFAGNGFQSVDPALTSHPWEKSPACQQLIETNTQLNNLDDLTTYFVTKVSEIARDAGINGLYAYHDILTNIPASTLATNRAGVSFWQSVWEGGFDKAYEWPSRDFETVISSPDFLYFDFPYEVDPKERGFYWATRFIDTRKVFSFAPENLPQNAETSVTRDGAAYSAVGTNASSGFKGMQGYLWSETVRTGAQFDYMIFPRLLAVAERAWHRADWELDYAPGVNYSNTSNLVNKSALTADWQRFANALGQKELAKLDAAGVAYRVPVAGARSSAGTVEMNSTFPGLALEFSTDGTNWQPYNSTQRPAQVSHVRVRSANNARTGRETAFDTQP